MEENTELINKEKRLCDICKCPEGNIITGTFQLVDAGRKLACKDCFNKKIITDAILNCSHCFKFLKHGEGYIMDKWSETLVYCKICYEGLAIWLANPKGSSWKDINLMYRRMQKPIQTSSVFNSE